MTSPAASIVMAGRDHGLYGVVDSAAVSPRVGIAISVGADKDSPSLRFKGSVEVPNEDAVLAFEFGPVVVLAVADAHFGHESSHQLIDGIARQLDRDPPANLNGLYEILTLIGVTTASETESESTLLVTVLDREGRSGFGISFGDSTAVLVGPQGGFRQLNQQDSMYVRARSFLTPTLAASFYFEALPEDVLIVYTDGVDECHYRNPKTSVQAVDIEVLVDRFGADPAQLASELAACALAGVHGNPGGQDNIAIAAASTAAQVTSAC